MKKFHGKSVPILKKCFTPKFAKGLSLPKKIKADIKAFLRLHLCESENVKLFNFEKSDFDDC